jgi:DNA-directed RNA polymerase specialized sigma24 family protein
MLRGTLATRPPLFATTRWSLVVAAGGGESADALEELCGIYWFPIYAVIRRSGKSSEDAKDLAQAFFAMMLERGTLGLADDARGRFRSFLQATLKRFLIGEWRREQAAKRGGGRELLALDGELAERLYTHEDENARSPEELFDRRWALAMLEAAMGRLAEDYKATGRAEEFERLMPTLTAERGETDYAALAAQCGSTEGALRVAAHRLRKRFRTLVREEVARTVVDASEVDEEMEALMAALSR